MGIPPQVAIFPPRPGNPELALPSLDTLQVQYPQPNPARLLFLQRVLFVRPGWVHGGPSKHRSPPVPTVGGDGSLEVADSAVLGCRAWCWCSWWQRCCCAIVLVVVPPDNRCASSCPLTLPISPPFPAPPAPSSPCNFISRTRSVTVPSFNPSWERPPPNSSTLPSPKQLGGMFSQASGETEGDPLLETLAARVPAFRKRNARRSKSSASRLSSGSA